MKIISWNCCNGFNKEKALKFIEILNNTENEPDIMVIQECYKNECDYLNFKYKSWFGDGKDSYKGIGIFSNEYEIERTLEHNINFRYIVPFRMTSYNKKVFILFIVWTKNVCCDYPYIGQVYGAINYPGYKKLFNEPVVIIGDFNANKNWDEENIKINNPTFMEVINRFEEKGIFSFYHKKYSCEYGEETHKSHFNSNSKKFYHIDYCFSSENMNQKNITIPEEIEWENKGDVKKWKNLSDHSPLIAEFEY